jgi:hypothetical protein
VRLMAGKGCGTPSPRKESKKEAKKGRGKKTDKKK